MLELRGPVSVTLELTSVRTTELVPGNTTQANGCQESSLSVTEWELIIASLAPYIHEYRVGGGEPTEHPDFSRILKILDATGAYFHLLTNGAWKDPVPLFSVFEQCAHLAFITFSLNGHDADTHNAFTRRNDTEHFNQLVSNIRQAVAAGFPVATNTLLSQQNIPHLAAIAELSASLGVRCSIFSRITDPGMETISPDAEQLRQACRVVDSLKVQGYNVVMGNCFPCCFYPSPTAGCYAGITSAAVDARGNLKPCRYSGVIGGNLLKDSVTKAWRSGPMRSWRNMVHASCSRCTRLGICPSGCKVREEHTGTPDPLISRAQEKPVEPQELEVTLRDTFRPVPRYRARDEDFGWLLIKGSSVIPVNAGAGKILRAIDETKTLGEIGKKIGPAALSFIYSLYLREFVEFK